MAVWVLGRIAAPATFARFRASLGEPRKPIRMYFGEGGEDGHNIRARALIRARAVLPRPTPAPNAKLDSQTALPRDSARRYRAAHRSAHARLRRCGPQLLGTCFRMPFVASHAARLSAIRISFRERRNARRRASLDLYS